MEDMFEYLKNFPKYCYEGFELGDGIKIKKPDNIVVSGMGGSAIPGDILAEMNLPVPVIVNRSYSLPSFVSRETLVFSISYSGKTKETLSCFREAKRIGAKIIAISSDGKLSKLAHSLIKIPKGLPPRCAIGYLFFPMLRILQNSGIINVEKDMNKLKKWKLGDVEKKAKKIANLFYNRFPLVYSSSCPVAYRMKTQLNENSKTIGLAASYPEIFHNEVEGYMVKNAKFAVLILDVENGPFEKKLSGLERILKKRGIKYLRLNFRGSKLLNMLKAIWIGDLATYYLAKKYKVNPIETKEIKWLKELESRKF
ncbi:MAG: bifunctional phosphoglucose/phosphomannose isomerase [Candidatus Aenigmarchaeota archaeon]|nr:bifunctional phosphoglucose/phosphomannose isomerase [Candidatus Aenigmarchaeota archaeon]